MPSKDFITNLLNLQHVLITNYIEDETSICIYASSVAPRPICPHCNKPLRIHDYRTHKINFGSFRGKSLFVFLRKRRFVCPCSKQIITENLNSVAKHHRISKLVFNGILSKLKETFSMSAVASLFHVSVSTVMRYFDLIAYPKITQLPTHLAIDEFKGNTGGFKYNAIITDPYNHKVLDILKTRDKAYISQYFSTISNRNEVQFFHQDMWQQYKDCATSKFTNAHIVVDKYHYVRQVYWAIENVRKREQKRLIKEERLFFKRCKYLLYKNTKTVEETQMLYNIFSHSYDLEVAYELKQQFESFKKTKTKKEAEKELRTWILMAEESKLKEFNEVIKTFRNWSNEITNSKETEITNAYTEGINNKIKVLKRNAFGYRNFERFRNRILHICA